MTQALKTRFVPLTFISEFAEFIEKTSFNAYEHRRNRTMIYNQFRSYVKSSGGLFHEPGFEIYESDWRAIINFCLATDKYPNDTVTLAFIACLENMHARLPQLPDEPLPIEDTQAHAVFDYETLMAKLLKLERQEKTFYEAHAKERLNPHYIDYLSSLCIKGVLDMLADTNDVRNSELFLTLFSETYTLCESDEERDLLFLLIPRTLQAYRSNVDIDVLKASQIFFKLIETHTNETISSKILPVLLTKNPLELIDFLFNVLQKQIFGCVFPGIFSLEAHMFSNLKGLPESLDRVAEVGKEFQPKVNELNENLKSWGEGFVSSAERITKQLNQANETGNTFVETIKPVPPMLDKFNSTFDRFTKILEDIKRPVMQNLGLMGIGLNLLAIVERIVGFVATCIALYKVQDNAIRGLIVLIFATSSGITSTLVTIIASFIKSAIAVAEEKDEPVAHGFGEELTENAFTALVDVFKNMFSVTSTAQKKIDSNRVSMVKSYASMFKMSKDFVTFIVNLCQQALYAVYEGIYEIPYDADEATIEKFKEMSLWMAKMQEVLEKDIQSERKFSQFRKLFCELYTQGKQLELFVAERQLENGKISIFLKMMKHAETIKEALLKYAKSDKGRIRPVVMQFFGKPNVGKSILIDYIINDVMHVLNLKYSSAEKYPLEPDRDFMDSYDNQFAVVMDDFMQHATTEAQTSAALLLIKLANDATFMTNQASLENKGIVFFDSPFVILTSNTEHTPNNLNLTDINAFKRRRDFFVKVTTNRDVNSTEPFTRDRYIFDLYDPITEQLVKPKVTYAEIVEEAVKLYKLRSSDSGRAIKYITSQPPPTSITKLVEKYTAHMLRAKRNKKRFIPSDDEDSDFEADAYNEERGTWRPKGVSKEQWDAKYQETAQKFDKQYKVTIDTIFQRLPSGSSLRGVMLDEIFEEKKKFCSDLVDSVFRGVSQETAEKKMHVEVCEHIKRFESMVVYQENREKVETEVRTRFEKMNSDSLGKLDVFILGITPERKIELLKLYEDFKQSIVTQAADRAFEQENAKRNNQIVPMDINMNATYFVIDLIKKEVERMKEVETIEKKVENGKEEAEIEEKPVNAETVYQDTINRARKEISKISEATPKKESLKLGIQKAVEDTRSWFKKSIQSIRKAIVHFATVAKHMVIEPHKKTIGVVLLSVAGLLGTIGGTVALVKYLNKDKEEVSAQTGGSDVYDPQIQSNKPPVRYVKKPVTVQGYKAQSSDNAANDLMCHQLPKNMATLRMGGGEVKALFIKDRIFITVKHILETYPGEDFQIESRGGVYKVPHDKYEVRLSAENDLALVIIQDLVMPAFPDITSKFLKADNISYLADAQISLLIKKGQTSVIRTTSRPSELSGSIQYTFRPPGKTERRIVNTDSITVPVESYKGECGSPYVLHNTKVTEKIIGIHVAGATNAICCIVTQEDIETLLEGVTAHAAELVIGPIENSKVALDAFDTPNVELIGTVPKNMEVRQPVDSELTKTIMHNKFQLAKTMPAMLKPDRVSGVAPMHMGLKKKLIRPANNNVSKWRTEIIQAIVDSIPTLVTPRILTHEEAINGVDGYTHLKPIDRKTSPGWPKNVEPGKAAGKLDHLIYNEESGKYEPTLKLKQETDALIEKHKIKAFGSPDIVVCDNMKDEGLPIEKVIDEHGMPVGNTRIMNSMPFEALVEERMLFGAFFENILRWQATGKSYVDLGINLDSSVGVRKFANMIKKHRDPVALAGDLKKQDASTPRELLEMSSEIIRGWYKRNSEIPTEYFEVMKNFRTELSYVMHIAINLLYRATGNPSGNFLTTVVNTFDTLIPFIEAALQINEDKGYPRTVQDVIDDIISRFSGFGDDHYVLVERGGDYDMFAIQRAFAKWGMEYTGIYKNRPLVAYYEWHEAKYLQRFFVFNNGQIFAALDKEVIEEIPYWKKKDQSNEIALPILVDSALRHAFNWGQEYFEACKTKYNNFLISNGIKPVGLLFSDLMRSFHQIQENYEAHMSGAPAPALVERSEVSNPINTVVTTTKFADNVGKEMPTKEIIAVQPRIYDGTDPYPDQGLRQVLSRAYPVSSIVWSSTATSEQYLGGLDFPAALMAIPNITSKLERFQYLRAGVRISIRINSTAMHSGKLLIAWLPHYKDNDQNVPFQNIYTSSMNNCSILSANTTKTIDFIIPFVGPSNYWNMKDDPTTIAQGFFGQIQIFCLHPLNLLGATGVVTVNLTVYASFENPEPSGLGLRTTYEAHMQDGTLEEGRVKSKDETIAQVAKTTATTSFKNMISDFIPGLFSTATDMISNVASSALGSLFLDKPTSTQAVSKFVVSQQTSFSHTRGLDGAEFISANPENHVTTDYKVYDTVADYNLFSEYKLLPGLVLLGNFDSTNPIGYKPFIIPVAPTFCHTQTTVDGVRYDITPLGNLASFFKFWRGGIKYHIKFTTNRFATARVRLTWLPDPTYSASFVQNEDGDTVNMVLDITGDTSVSIVVPYLKDSFYDRVPTPDEATFTPTANWAGFNGQLVMSIVNPVANASDVVSSKIYFAVFMSGAEDFEVQKPVELWSGYGDGSKLEAHMATTEDTDMRALFRTTFQPIISAHTCQPQNLQFGESIDSWPELLKRYSQYKNIANTTQAEIDPWTNTTAYGGLMTKWERVRRSFLFCRGSVRYKIMSSSGLTDSSGYLYAYNIDASETYNSYGLYDRGCTFTDLRFRSVLEAQVPYYTRHNMNSSSYYWEGDYRPLLGLKFFQTTVSTFFNGFVLISAGDDFTVGYPTNPVPLIVYTGDSNKNKALNRSISRKSLT